MTNECNVTEWNGTERTTVRDGVRLCRLVEVLSGRCGDKSVLRAAKFPATSRAARLHNVAAALAAAKDCGVELPASWAHVTPADIVDGHLANTLVGAV